MENSTAAVYMLSFGPGPGTRTRRVDVEPQPRETSSASGAAATTQDPTVDKHHIIEAKDWDEVIQEKSMHGQVKFDPYLVQRFGGCDDLDFDEDDDSYEEASSDVHEIKIIIPNVKTSFIKLRVTLTSDCAIMGWIEEVKEDPSAPSILCPGSTDENKQILKCLLFRHLHPFAPRDCHEFDLTQSAPYGEEMISSGSAQGCIRDSYTFAEEPYLDFCVCVGFTDAFVNYLKFCKAQSPFPFLQDSSQNIMTKILYNDAKHADFSIIVGESSFKVHKEILADKSAVFETMFGSGLVEQQQNILTITDFEAESINEMISYIYQNKLTKWTKYSDMSLMVDLLLLGDKYDIPALKNVATDMFLAQPCKDNALEDSMSLFGCPNDDFSLAIGVRWFEAICLLDNDEIINKSVKFILPKLGELSNDQNWNGLVVNNPKLREKLDAALAKSKEEDAKDQPTTTGAKKKQKKDVPKTAQPAATKKPKKKTK